MIVRNGIDCASRITNEVAAKLVAAQQTFVCRYLVPETYKKYLSKEEAQIISDAGLDILSCYETTAKMALGDTKGGTTDGQIALNCARKVGQPKGSAIYFAVDFDVTKPEEYDIIERYLRAAQTALGTEYEVGVYAEFTVINAMKARGVCKYFWQTYAWSAGQRSPHANVFQYRNGQSMAGITVDLNNSFGNEGFWNLRKPPKALTTFKDVPVGHYSEVAISEMKALGIMAGFSDTEFGFGKPVTREEFAIFMSRLLKEVKRNVK